MVTLHDALSYFDRGLCVLPAKDKEPDVDLLPNRKWTPYQTRRPTEDEVRQWFGGDDLPQIAVMTGEVSGNLVVRDFDRMEAYELWAAEYPTLAATLPTVATARPGRHVYAASDLTQLRADFPGKAGIFDCYDNEGEKDGELRTGGGICILPPSSHPTGPSYRWLTPLGDQIPRVEMEETGWLLGMRHRPHSEPRGRMTLVGDNTVSTASTVSHGGDGRAIAQSNDRPKSQNQILARLDLDPVDFAIASALPTKKGQRHASLFQLARELKAIEHLADAPVTALRPIVKRWHAAAVSIIGTKAWEESWLDFAEGWSHVKYPAAQGPLDVAFAKATATTPPACADVFDQTAVRMLVSLCRELQIGAGDVPFFLGARSVGNLFGVSHATGARWLRMLLLEGVLELVTVGGLNKGTGKRKGKRDASSYFYRGN